MDEGSIFIKKEEDIDKVYISCYGDYGMLCLMFGKALSEIIKNRGLDGDAFIKDIRRFIDEKSDR